MNSEAGLSWIETGRAGGTTSARLPRRWLTRTARSRCREWLSLVALDGWWRRWHDNRLIQGRSRTRNRLICRSKRFGSNRTQARLELRFRDAVFKIITRLGFRNKDRRRGDVFRVDLAAVCRCSARLHSKSGGRWDDDSCSTRKAIVSLVGTRSLHLNRWDAWRLGQALAPEPIHDFLCLAAGCVRTRTSSRCWSRVSLECRNGRIDGTSISRTRGENAV